MFSASSFSQEVQNDWKILDLPWDPSPINYEAIQELPLPFGVVSSEGAAQVFQAATAPVPISLGLPDVGPETPPPQPAPALTLGGGTSSAQTPLAVHTIQRLLGVIDTMVTDALGQGDVEKDFVVLYLDFFDKFMIARGNLAMCTRDLGPMEDALTALAYTREKRLSLLA